MVCLLDIETLFVFATDDIFHSLDFCQCHFKAPKNRFGNHIDRILETIRNKCVYIL